MAVSQPTIKAELLAIYLDARSSPMTEDEFADRMATAIANAILSAELDGTAPNVQSGGTNRVLVGGLT